MAREKTYKLKWANDIQEGDNNGNSYVANDDENKEIIANFLKSKTEKEGSKLTLDYLTKTINIEQSAIIDFWFNNQVELTELKGEAKGYNKIMYTDGKNKIELQLRDVYTASVKFENWNVIEFYDKFGDVYYKCEIASYKKGDENVAFEKYLNDKRAKNQLTEEKKKEVNAESKQKAEFLGLKKLKGTQKQRDWATTIRQKVIDELGTEYAYKLISIKYTNTAKFWIENRYKRASEFRDFIVNFDKKQKDIIFLEKWKIQLSASELNKLLELNMADYK